MSIDIILDQFKRQVDGLHNKGITFIKLRIKLEKKLSVQGDISGCYRLPDVLRAPSVTCYDIHGNRASR